MPSLTPHQFAPEPHQLAREPRRRGTHRSHATTTRPVNSRSRPRIALLAPNLRSCHRVDERSRSRRRTYSPRNLNDEQAIVRPSSERQRKRRTSLSPRLRLETRLRLFARDRRQQSRRRPSTQDATAAAGGSSVRSVIGHFTSSLSARLRPDGADELALTSARAPLNKGLFLDDGRRVQIRRIGQCAFADILRSLTPLLPPQGCESPSFS